jgi:hypothetical protein
MSEECIFSSMDVVIVASLWPMRKETRGLYHFATVC